LRTHNPVDNDPGITIPGDRLDEQVGTLNSLLTSRRELKFHEMEYWLPYEDGPACFAEIRRRMKEHHRRDVGWRVLVRIVDADDAFLSPGFRRKSMTITVHQNASLPFESFFADLEPVFQRFGGRPHWAKLHTLEGAKLRALYPEWETFESIRRRLDPKGCFLNRYLRKSFGQAA
jgi:FAD/FMN-containing dehydrogenase